MDIQQDGVIESYDIIKAKIKNLPEHRRHLFLFGIRAEYNTIIQLCDMLKAEYMVEYTKQCGECKNLWNVVITVR